jgi:hypothetical protein
VNNYVVWDRPALGTNDFIIESQFKVAAVANTAIAFVIWSASGAKLVGLDSFFYEGGSWGPATVVGSTTLTTARFHTLKLVRRQGRLSVTLDGVGIAGLADLELAEAVSAVGWRPWRNAIDIVTLCQRTAPLPLAVGMLTMPACLCCCSYPTNPQFVDCSLHKSLRAIASTVVQSNASKGTDPIGPSLTRHMCRNVLKQTPCCVADASGASSAIQAWATSLPLIVRADAAEYLSELVLTHATRTSELLSAPPSRVAAHGVHQRRVWVGFAVEAQSGYLDYIATSASLWLEVLGRDGRVLICLVGDGWAVGRARQLVQELSLIDRKPQLCAVHSLSAGWRVVRCLCAWLGSAGREYAIVCTSTHHLARCT